MQLRNDEEIQILTLRCQLNNHGLTGHLEGTRCLSVLCPVSVLSHSVESCGTYLTRPGIVFHNAIIKV